MHEGLKTILEQLYEQTPDIEALKDALILLVNNGELSIDDIMVLDNHYASEALFDPLSFMSFVRLIAEKVDYYAPKNLEVLLRKMYQRDSETITNATIEMITDEYSLSAIQSLIKHLKAEGWSFAYMGTDHDVQGVTISLSITNVIQFEKTEAETHEVFVKEKRARERYSRKMWEFEQAMPMASNEERKRYQTQISEEYYDETDSNTAYAGRVTPEKVTNLAPNEIFVFGSNDQGIHKGGAAYLALKKFGAQMGVSSGLQGSSYAIPTVGNGIGPQEIADSFHTFVEFAKAHPEKTFLLTALGCGHGGYEPDYISRYLEEGINVSNIHYPMEFWAAFEKRGLV